MAKINAIPEYSVVTVNNETGILHLNRLLGVISGFIETDADKTIELNSNAECTVIATPYDLARNYVRKIKK